MENAITSFFQRTFLPFTIGDGTTAGSAYGNNKQLDGPIRQDGYSKSSESKKDSAQDKKSGDTSKARPKQFGSLLQTGERNVYGGAVDYRA